MSLLALALVTATPGTIAQTLDSVRPGDTIVLRSGSYRNIVIRRTFATPITIDAAGATVRGLRITGGGVIWRSGTILSPQGADGIGANGYGALVNGSNVTFTGVTFSQARKGVVLDLARRVTITDSFFRALGEDGIIASRTAGMTVLRNTFDRTIGKPTTCTVGRGVLRGLSRRDCVGRRGIWIDGFHPDAMQMRNAVTDAVIADNVVNADTQGITQMDTIGDAPLARIRIERNRVAGTIHHITLGNCNGCTIRDNVVRRWRPDSYKAVIRSGRASRCGNEAQDEPRDRRC